MSAIKQMTARGPIADYLRCTEIVDFDDPAVARLASGVSGGSSTEVLRRSFELVCDRFPHSADAGRDEVACSASDVVRLGHGLCYAKSHLLAALLRANGIPAGFCYQRLKGDAKSYILHGLNAVLVGERWVGLDARGNNDRVRVEFDLAGDMRAYRPDDTLGELDYHTVFSRPDAGVIRLLRSGKSRLALLLPADLAGDE